MISPDELREIADNDGYLRQLHLALEDQLIEWRDMRLSTPFVANGLVVREADGSDSSTIRIPTRTAIEITLKKLADILESEGAQ